MVMLISVGGWVNGDVVEFKPGTYLGTSQGNNGPVTVEVKVDEKSILSVKVVSHRETAGISDNAIKLIPMQILKNQSLAVDAISGATKVSNAIIEAAKQAIEKAGVNSAQLATKASTSNGGVVKLKPGTYTGYAYGKWTAGSNEGARFGSPKEINPIAVEVRVDDKSILGVTVTSCDDTPGFKEPVIERIPKSIMANQSIAVDVVTGCTMTSNGVISAVTQALEKAGADVLAFNKKIPKVNGNVEYTVDVAVVGGGGSGTAAALAATEKGAKVLVLEKTGKVGGMSACTTGFIGVGSTFAEAAGNTKTVDEIFTEMMDYSNWTANPILVKTILEKSGDTAEWLADHGYKLKIGGYGYTHDTGKGTDKIQNLYDKYILPKGGRLLLETTAEELIMENGKVVGVKAIMQNGTKVIVHAKSVIIATGGFGGNPEMLKQYTNSSNYWLSGLSSSAGDGINMALKAGAVLSDELIPHLTEFAASSKLDYNDSFMKYMNYGGLLQVNLEGKRFMDEGLCASQPLAKGASAIRNVGSFYVVLDQTTLDTLETRGFTGLLGKEKTEELKKAILWRDRAIGPLTTIKAEMQEAMDAGLAFKADSFENLEAAAGFDKGVFVDTMNRYLNMVAQKRDDDFLKESHWLTPLAKGPFYMVRMEPAIFGTLGGIRINEKIQALNEDLKPISGLYIAGQDGGGMYGYPYYEIPGVTQGYAYNSGRIAGEEAADSLKK
jgi:fumarate reductase flavoprotein subunit